MNLNIAISSGKGGTGKTFIATNIARTLEQSKHSVRYLDCDVEAPNGHLFLKPEIHKEETVTLLSPMEVDTDKCTACGKCVTACQYNALALIKGKLLFFQNMCHICGACTLVCPTDAIIEKDREIGKLKHGRSGSIDFHYGLLKTGEGGMSPRVIKRVKQCASDGINILDSSPGTACPVVETVKDADLCVLVTDPTPFGVHDLKLAVDMCREPVVVVNRADYMNRDLKTYCEVSGLEILGEIPDDRKIAECYSVGNLAVDELPEYRSLFQELADAIVRRAQNPKSVQRSKTPKDQKLKSFQQIDPQQEKNYKAPKTHEIVVISGKGGTGKTSLVASFCALEKNIAIADCDVDAADLHLILKPEIQERGWFSGGNLATIDPDKCTGCGICAEHCRFEAIHSKQAGDRIHYKVDVLSCEGCGVCSIVCPENAIKNATSINGEWYLSDTRFGPMSHAKLGVAEENSGKLVTQVRNNKDRLAERLGLKKSLIDGSPGTGCPVIASLTGANYALVVTEPTVSGVHDLKRVLDVIRFFRIPSGVIVNKSDLNPKITEEIRLLSKQNGSDFLGTIPYDRQITEAQVAGQSIIEYTDGPISETILLIWKNVKERVLNPTL
ncbi:4Fe-4S binding protein [candidate division KSB1 bacterium]|nr:4Fe-4S binding protein [candidate division KSB1 bacterium]